MAKVEKTPIVGFLAPAASREIGERHVQALSAGVREAVIYALDKTGWRGKCRIRVGTGIFNVPTQLPSELHSLVREITDGKPRIPKAMLNTSVVRSEPSLLAVLFAGGFLDPAEWKGVVEEVREEQATAEADVVATFRRIFEGEGQLEPFEGSGGTRYEFNPEARHDIERAIRALVGQDVVLHSLKASVIAKDLLDRCPDLASLRREGKPRETLTAIVSFVLFEPS
jgi:hypothetical protein